MKLYTEPKLEIVTIKANDVITTSGTLAFLSLFRSTSLDDGGRASLNNFSTDSFE